MKLFKKQYRCLHCGRKHDNAFMAQLCFDLDMKLLKSQNNETQGKNKKIHNK